MKRFLLSIALVAIGASFWWLLSRTAQFSVKKWDAKFETVLRHGLDAAGVSNADVLSNVHEVRKDGTGEWVITRMRVRVPDPSKRRRIEDDLRSSGADVSAWATPAPTLVVRRNGRIYQEITFAPR